MGKSNVIEPEGRDENTDLSTELLTTGAQRLISHAAIHLEVEYTLK